MFSVGWNRVGGWRLWLLDAEGNQYYYAHLSGYSALARNNHHVRRGEVLGFVGNTGDAITTWPHVHFEVHPNATLYLGYDGAVDPTRYLAAWTRIGHVSSVPPPVPLPSGAPSGEGAIKDFRALLAIRPMKVSPKVAESAARRRPASQPPHGRDRTFAPGWAFAGRRRRVADRGRLRIARGRTRGAVPLVARRAAPETAAYSLTIRAVCSATRRGAAKR